MPIINDDHFLAFCSILITISAIIAGPFWGKVGDHYGFKLTLIIIIALDICCKIFGLFCNQRWSLAFLYFMLGFNDKGVLTLMGPGLIEMFGL
jgi:MFS family permease